MFAKKTIATNWERNFRAQVSRIITRSLKWAVNLYIAHVAVIINTKNTVRPFCAKNLTCFPSCETN